jgi:serine/threonine protein phosphatase PrpC/quercetin dioxygenase-like cupin family protein
MGGQAAGEIASALAVRTVHEELKNNRSLIEAFDSGAPVSPKEILTRFESAVQTASARIHAEAQNDSAKRGMGTTFVAMLLIGNKGFIAHVGDSRLYMMRDGKVQQVTEDHTVYNELMKRGKLSKEQVEKLAQKNAITRAVGVYDSVEVDTLLVETIPGDCFLLCSDGLHGYIQQNTELVPYMKLADGDVAVRSLIDLANDRGGKDNVTALVIQIGTTGADDGARARRLALKRQVLAKMPLFARLSEREMLRVMQVADVKIFQKGDTVIKEGDSGDELFIVLSGSLTVTRGGGLLTELSTGDHVGEMALIRNVPRSATVVCNTAAELITLKRADFFEILRKEHELAVKLLWQFLGVIADRLDQTSRDLHSARSVMSMPDIFPMNDDEHLNPLSLPPSRNPASIKPSSNPPAPPPAPPAPAASGDAASPPKPPPPPPPRSKS